MEKPWLGDADPTVVGKAVVATWNYALKALYDMKDGHHITNEEAREVAWATFVLLASNQTNDPVQAAKLKMFPPDFPRLVEI